MLKIIKVRVSSLAKKITTNLEKEIDYQEYRRFLTNDDINGVSLKNLMFQVIMKLIILILLFQ